MPGVARIGDASTADPCGAAPRPSSSASPNVYVNSKNVHRLGDAWVPHACPNSSPHGAVTSSGSGTVFVNGKPIARAGDSISCGSTIAGKSDNVFAN